MPFQDNESLMRAISKLIYLYNPDLVLPVGEALVGNDAVDQLYKFKPVENQIHVVHLRLSLIYLHVKLFSYRNYFPVLAEIGQSFDFILPQIDRRDITH